MIRLILLTLLICTVVSCNTTDGDLPYKFDNRIFAEDPYITGKITRIGIKQIGNDSYSEILIEENPSVNEPLERGGKKIRLTIREQTEIFLLKNGNTYYSKKEDLKVGQIVSGWIIKGVVLDSYPQQAGAKRILTIQE